MADLDLTEAISALCAVRLDPDDVWYDADDGTYVLDEANASLLAHSAAPLIAAQVRAQIAADILVLARPHDAKGFSAVGDAYAHAARVARGDS